MKSRAIGWIVFSSMALGLPAAGTAGVSTIMPAQKPVAPIKQAADASAPKIREFDLETIARLGYEICLQDQLAWYGTDALLISVGEEKLSKIEAAGWVVETSGKEAVVRFLQRRDGKVDVAYDVRFPEGAAPVVEEPKDRALTKTQLARYHATETALRLIVDGQHPWCGGQPNHVVLPDPEGDGWLVYLLRPKPTPSEVPVGGHYRISVSADGKTVRQVDQLWAGCLTMDKAKMAGPGNTVAAMTASHVVSNTPVETHVYIALQEQIPLYVATPDNRMWLVHEGKVTLLGAMDGGDAKTEPKARAPSRN